jgi:hypothetical protein
VGSCEYVALCCEFCSSQDRAQARRPYQSPSVSTNAGGLATPVPLLLVNLGGDPAPSGGTVPNLWWYIRCVSCQHSGGHGGPKNANRNNHVGTLLHLGAILHSRALSTTCTCAVAQLRENSPARSYAHDAKPAQQNRSCAGGECRRADVNDSVRRGLCPTTTLVITALIAHGRKIRQTIMNRSHASPPPVQDRHMSGGELTVARRAATRANPQHDDARIVHSRMHQHNGRSPVFCFSGALGAQPAERLVRPFTIHR